MAMLPKERVLATRLMIAMAEWPKESRQNMVEWVQDALKEQRRHERGACQEIALCYGGRDAEEIAEMIGSRTFKE